MKGPVCPVTGKERALTALSGGRPDRVARYADLRHPDLIRKLGGPGEGLGPAVRSARELGIDMTRDPARAASGGPVRAASTLDVGKVLSETKQSFLEGLDAARDDLLVLLEFPHAILGAVMARHGAMDTLSLFAASPPDAAALLEETSQTCIRLAEEIAEWEDVHAVLFMDDLAGNAGPLISPETLRSLYFPRLREVVAVFSRTGIKVIFHSDGDLSMLATDILSAGAAGHHPVEPVGNWSLESAAMNGEGTLIVGNADFGKLCASPREAREERERCLAFGETHASYFMAPTSEIGPEVPPENLVAFFS